MDIWTEQNSEHTHQEGLVDQGSGVTLSAISMVPPEALSSVTFAGASEKRWRRRKKKKWIQR
jgi:hypothetical protein